MSKRTLLRRFEPTTHQCALHMHTRETRGNFSEPSISEQTAVHKCLRLMEFKRWGMPPVYKINFCLNQYPIWMFLEKPLRGVQCLLCQGFITFLRSLSFFSVDFLQLRIAQESLQYFAGKQCKTREQTLVLFKVGPTRAPTHLPTSAPTCYFSAKNAMFSFG
jgi:hypothetical protein